MTEKSQPSAVKGSWNYHRSDLMACVGGIDLRHSRPWGEGTASLFDWVDGIPYPKEKTPKPKKPR